jgi:thiol:disulfide interchange protein DsbD
MRPDAVQPTRPSNFHRPNLWTRVLRTLAVLAVASGLLGTTTALAEDAFLPPEQAFQYATRIEQGQIVVAYTIRDGYYLYRKRISFATDTPGVTLAPALYPKGLPHQDEYFGEQEVYRGAATFRVPYTAAAGTGAVDLKLKLQGCADAGLCYPPQTWVAHVALPAAPAPSADTARAGAAGGSVLAKLLGKSAPAASAPDEDFLPPEQAFRFSVEPAGPDQVRLHWTIAEGYYLYRDRIKLSGESQLVKLGAVQLPKGLPHQDDYFGAQEIYRDSLTATVPYTRASPAPGRLALKVSYQGCADKGLCYPPQVRELDLEIPAAGAGAVSGGSAGSAAPASEQDRLALLIREGNLLLVVASFFGFGLLLAFTPCVLPMVPILSGIIAGDGDRVTPARGFALSLAYVFGMAVTYTIAGAAFAAAGKQAQSFFQQTWIIVVFGGMFVLLALAMFGLYELQMPSALQTRFANASNQIRGGKFISTAIMGALSSLVVTACVAPPLVAALAVIGQAGDIVRGALALFSLSFGMGTPLLVVGASAGKLLPKAGAWMETVKAVFGVVFLGVAAWMFDRVLSPRLMLVVWALVAFSAVWVLLRVGVKGGRRGWQRLGSSAVAGLYGAALLGGAAVGGTDPLNPYAGTGVLGASAHIQTLPFRTVKSVADLDRELAAAASGGRRVMLDFYADWCVSCKEMEARTFRDPAVRAALANYVLLKADVTANDATDQALLKRFGIFGPPTTAFFATDGKERLDSRLVGFVAPEAFRSHLAAFEAAP